MKENENNKLKWNFNYELNNKNHSETKYVIYLITNTISQKYYIGQTRRELRKRWNDYKKDLLKPIQVEKRSGNNIKLKRSVQKHFNEVGNTDFLHFSILEIIDTSHTTIEEEKQTLLNKREIFHIKEYRKLFGKHKVFNIADGGRQHIWTEEEKLARKGKHISPETEFKKGEMSGENNPFFGKQHTEEFKERKRKERLGFSTKDLYGEEKSNEMSLKKRDKMLNHWNATESGEKQREMMSKKFSGENNPMYGIPSPLTGKHHSEEAKRKIRAATSKTFDLSNNPLISPNSEVYLKIVCMADFCKEHGLQQPNLVHLINGKIKSHKGWKIQRCS